MAEASEGPPFVRELLACCNKHGNRRAIDLSVLTTDDLEELCEGAPADTIELANRFQVVANDLSQGWGFGRVLEAKVGRVLPSLAAPPPTASSFECSIPSASVVAE